MNTGRKGEKEDIAVEGKEEREKWKGGDKGKTREREDRNESWRGDNIV